jgi:UDP-N-acetylglucosamine 4,6-dehydratase/5-epimerase
MSEDIFHNKTVLITGGTGSFGSYFVKNILDSVPDKIIIYSRDEDKQYSLQYELKFYLDKLRFVIGDVRNLDSLKKAMDQGVDYVIHAAALKQIPSTEYNILEAVRTNIMGAQNVVDAAIWAGVSKVLSISTDKAVEPINVMGMTKGIQERIFTLANLQAGSKKTKFASVRYGNVLESRGSIIPLFKKQIAQGGPLTVTDNRMTRFIITLNQATKLVFYALRDMKGGEIFVPVIHPLMIKDLAEVIVEKTKPKDKRIVEIGIRPGEKLHETLISPIESIRTVKKKDYYVIFPQINIKNVGFTYQVSNIKAHEFRYSSDTGTLMTRKDISALLKKENVFI